MKARVIVAVILVLILLALAILAPLWLLVAVLAAVNALMAFEFMRGAGLAKDAGYMLIALLFAAAVPEWIFFGSNLFAFTAALFLLTLLLFFKGVVQYRGENGAAFAIMAVIFSALIIPFMFNSILRIRLLENGAYLVMLPFVAAYCSDTGAFFTGRAFGKRKLIPHVSPHKTVAGAVGGIAGSVLGMMIYGLIIKLACGLSVSFPILIFYGLIGSPAAQLGDLAFSLMKREFKIKDYGNLLPGHGGMLDRVDSVVFAAPLIYSLIILLPAIGV